MTKNNTSYLFGKINDYEILFRQSNIYVRRRETDYTYTFFCGHRYVWEWRNGYFALDKMGLMRAILAGLQWWSRKKASDRNLFRRSWKEKLIEYAQISDFLYFRGRLGNWKVDFVFFCLWWMLAFYLRIGSLCFETTEESIPEMSYHQKKGCGSVIR